LRPDRVAIKQCRNLLLPRFDTFGDIVLLEGLLRALLDLLPEARITVFVREGYDQLAELFPDRLTWKTTKINPYKEAPDVVEVSSFLEELGADSYDLLLTTTYNRTWPDDLIAAKLHSAWRVALGEATDVPDYLLQLLRALGVESPCFPYDEFVPVVEKNHETEKYQALWERLTGEKERLPKPQLSISNGTAKKSEEVLEKLGLKQGRFFFCFPAGTLNISLKNWPEDCFAEVIAYLEKRFKLTALVSGHESERGIIEKVVELAKEKGAHSVLWLGKDSDIPLACALAKRSCFYLGNDTGLMHMTAALNKPVIAIFGGGTWPRFLPVAKIGRAFVYPMPCFYCMWDCLFSEPLCIRSLNADAILQEIKGLVDEILHGNGDFKVIEEKANHGQFYMFFEKAVERLLLEKEKLQASEADREARLVEVIQQLGEKLQASETDREARLEVIQQLGEKLQASETDREARLEVIQQLGEKQQVNEADREARLEVIREYEREMLKISNRLDLSNSVLPKISIVTPSFNQVLYIEKTIQSVIDQGYPNLEYIIIDGGSTDGSLEVIKRYEAHLSYWISEPDSGQAEAINKGFSRATGVLVSWLNSDDTHREGALWEWVKAILRYPKADIWMASHHNYMDECDNVLSVMENVFVNHSEFVKYWRMGGIRVNQPSVFFRRELLDEVWEIDACLHYGLDYDFFLRLSRNHRIMTVDGNWINYRLHRGAKSGTHEGEGFYKFIPEWHLASKRQWGRPWNLRWWRFFLSFHFYRPFFCLGQLTSDFISRRQILLKWLFLWPLYLWQLFRGQGNLPRC
jgi:ADP-heptose:LPS heptosyltransferase/glycosyltransferase involved in cell wall biosynthesis